MAERIVDVATDLPIWERFFTVAPLVLVGTREPDGRHDLAPKHMAGPMGWDNFWGFVCSPRHATERNARATGAFTVSYLRAGQVLEAGLAAEQRGGGDAKPSLAALPVRPARAVDGVLVEGCSLWLECVLDRVVDGLGPNSIVIGRVVAAQAVESALRGDERDDADVIAGEPALCYLAPGRFAAVAASLSFPYPARFRR